MKLWFQHGGLTVLDGSQNASGQTDDSGENKSFVNYRGIKQIIILFCSLEIMDALVTYWAVNKGLVWEGNHLIAQMVGDWSFIFLKFLGAVLSGLILWILYEHFPKISMAAAVGIALFYGAVLVWNSSMLINIALLH